MTQRTVVIGGNAKHNYMKALAWLQERNPNIFAGAGVQSLRIEHDDRCGIYRESTCNCRPNIISQGKKLRYPRSILKASKTT